MSGDKLKWLANEGVRTSKILQKISQSSNESPLIAAFLSDAKNIRIFPGTTPRESIVSPVEEKEKSSQPRKERQR